MWQLLHWFPKLHTYKLFCCRHSFPCWKEPRHVCSLKFFVRFLGWPCEPYLFPRKESAIPRSLGLFSNLRVTREPSEQGNLHTMILIEHNTALKHVWAGGSGMLRMEWRVLWRALVIAKGMNRSCGIGSHYIDFSTCAVFSGKTPFKGLSVKQQPMWI